jgi:hypothetical protein
MIYMHYSNKNSKNIKELIYYDKFEGLRLLPPF